MSDRAIRDADPDDDYDGLGCPRGVAVAAVGCSFLLAVVLVLGACWS